MRLMLVCGKERRGRGRRRRLLRHRCRGRLVGVRRCPRLGALAGFAAFAPIASATAAIAPTTRSFASLGTGEGVGRALNHGGCRFAIGARFLRRTRLSRRALPIRIALTVAPVMARLAPPGFAPWLLA